MFLRLLGYAIHPSMHSSIHNHSLTHSSIHPSIHPRVHPSIMRPPTHPPIIHPYLREPLKSRVCTCTCKSASECFTGTCPAFPQLRGSCGRGGAGGDTGRRAVWSFRRAGSEQACRLVGTVHVGCLQSWHRGSHGRGRAGAQATSPLRWERK